MKYDFWFSYIFYVYVRCKMYQVLSVTDRVNVTGAKNNRSPPSEEIHARCGVGSEGGTQQWGRHHEGLCC